MTTSLLIIGKSYPLFSNFPGKVLIFCPSTVSTIMYYLLMTSLRRKHNTSVNYIHITRITYSQFFLYHEAFEMVLESYWWSKHTLNQLLHIASQDVSLDPNSEAIITVTKTLYLNRNVEAFHQSVHYNKSMEHSNVQEAAVPIFCPRCHCEHDFSVKGWNIRTKNGLSADTPWTYNK